MLTYTAFPHDMVGLGGRGTYSRRHNLRHPVPVPEGLNLQPLRQHLLDLRAAIEDVNFFLFPIYRISSPKKPKANVVNFNFNLNNNILYIYFVGLISLADKSSNLKIFFNWRGVKPVSKISRTFKLFV